MFALRWARSVFMYVCVDMPRCIADTPELCKYINILLLSSGKNQSWDRKADEVINNDQDDNC